MDCNMVREKLDFYLADELELSEIEQIEQHLDSCTSCQVQIREAKILHEELGTLLCAPAPSPDFENQIISRFGVDPEVTTRDLERTRETLADQAGRRQTKRQFILWRQIMTSRRNRIAAAIIIVVILGGLWSLVPMGQKGLAFADVVEPILKAKTAIYTIVVGEEGEGAEIRDMVMGSRIRRTLHGMNNVSIIDMETFRALALDPDKKTATYVDMKGLPEQSKGNQLEVLQNLIVELKKLPAFEVEDLGEQEMDGKIAIGFLAKCPQGKLEIWADPETGLPIRLRVDIQQFVFVLKDFEIDVEMDESLFSMEVPEGYTKRETELDLFGSTEEDFIEGLRIWAEVLGDGKFPGGVDAAYYIKQAPELKKKFDELGLSDDEELELGLKMQRFLLFTRFYKGQGKWFYRGSGVKLGDADTPIFWGRPPGSDTYRVIYGDLSVKDVAPEDLPEPLRQSEELKFKSNYVVSEEDEWTVISSEDIRARSTLVIRKSPETYEDLIVQLPFQKATVQKVRLGDNDLPFSRLEGEEYRVDLSAHQDAARSGTITVLWTFSPAACFTPSEMGRYWIPLKSLVPSDSFSLTVTIAEGSGFRFSLGDSEARTLRAFRGGVPGKPQMHYGSWGGLIKKEDKDTRGAQP